MRLAGAAITNKDYGFGAFDVATLSQFVDLGGRDLRSLAEVELIERLHARQMSILDPPGDGVAFALFQFGCQQRFQITQVSESLLDGLFGQRRALIGHGGQTQGAALLCNSGLFQVVGGGLHACTSMALESSWS